MSFRKNVLQNYKAINAGDMSGNLTSPSTNIQFLDNIGIQLLFPGAVASGQFFIDASLDNVNWSTLDIIPGMVASDPDGQILIDMNNMSFSHIRIRYVAVPGDVGSLTAFIEGKSI
jgi:hypothetical protein